MYFCYSYEMWRKFPQLVPDMGDIAPVDPSPVPDPS